MYILEICRWIFRDEREWYTFLKKGKKVRVYLTEVRVWWICKCNNSLEEEKVDSLLTSRHPNHDKKEWKTKSGTYLAWRNWLRDWLTSWGWAINGVSGLLTKYKCFKVQWVGSSLAEMFYCHVCHVSKNQKDVDTRYIICRGGNIYILDTGQPGIHVWSLRSKISFMYTDCRLPCCIMSKKWKKGDKYWKPVHTIRRNEALSNDRKENTKPIIEATRRETFEICCIEDSNLIFLLIRWSSFFFACCCAALAASERDIQYVPCSLMRRERDSRKIHRMLLKKKKKKKGSGQ